MSFAQEQPVYVFQSSCIIHSSFDLEKESTSLIARLPPDGVFFVAFLIKAGKSDVLQSYKGRITFCYAILPLIFCACKCLITM